MKKKIIILSMVATMVLGGCGTVKNGTSDNINTTKPVIQKHKQMTEMDYISSIKYYQDGIVKATQNPESMKNENIAVFGAISKIVNDDKTGVQKIYLDTVNFVEEYNQLYRRISGKSNDNSESKALRFIVNYDPKKFNGNRISTSDKVTFVNLIARFDSIDKNNVPIFNSVSRNIERGLVEGAGAIYQYFRETKQTKPNLVLLDKTKFTGKKSKFNDNTEFIFQDINSKKYYFTEMRVLDIEYPGSDPAEDNNMVGVIIREVKDTGDDFVVDETNKNKVYKIYPMYMLDSSVVYERCLKGVVDTFSFHILK